MNCAEVREYLFAFLDSELDAPLSIEIQRHLERCHDCAREAEVERSVRNQLMAGVEREAAGVPPFDETVGSMLRIESDHADMIGSTSVSHIRHWRRLASVAAVVLVGVSMSWFFLHRQSDAHGAFHLADVVVDDFRHFLKEGKTLQITSADRRSVSKWLTDKTRLAVMLPSPDPRFRLVGARKCDIAGRLAAFAMYDVEGTPASLIVMPADEAELAGMDRVVHPEGTHWVDRCRGHTVVACRRGPLIYAAVAALSEDKLLGLMDRTQYEGD